ncbi:MAG: indolepyruvate oxidoreductase subunit beta family protein [Sulfitobacter sp.]
MNMVAKHGGGATAVNEVLKLAILAVGGQGGGVLTAWIESVARAQGYDVQATSVAGVSQRTGATIYYIEMLPSSGQQPVFALAPSGGDVDVMIAAEMMEVGRSIIRGFVTPDKTTLIGSTHRQLAVSEKSIPGDGIADADEVRAAAEIAAQRLILADMDALAVAQGSVISASLFGALAGSNALPFPREAFEDAIRQSGKGVEASLRAFDAGYFAAQNGEDHAAPEARPAAPQITGSRDQLQQWNALIERANTLPEPVQDMVQAGLRKVVDFQDVGYGSAYLNQVERALKADSAAQDWQFSVTAAKYIANAMAYDDIIKVADLKTRAPRLARIRAEMGAGEAQLLQLTEFFHPRAEEVASLMPAAMGAKWEASPKRMALLGRLFGKGRRLRTDTIRAFLMLHILGGLKRYRLKTRRHAVETAHLENWLSRCLDMRERDYALAVELLRNRRLIKGYSDTHARGLSKFDCVMDAADLLKGREDAAVWMGRLREAALQDPEGTALDGAIETVKTFV